VTLDDDIGPLPLVERVIATHWPVSVLPAWMADHITDTAARLQVPEDLCAQLAVGALSAACAGHATVQVDDWVEPLNLYLFCSMHSGAGKSPAEKAMVGPLRDWERERRLRNEDVYSLAVAQWKVAQKKLRKAEDGYAVGSIGDTEFAEAVAEASEPMPTEFRLLVDDATPERLVQLLGTHERLALVSTEAGLLDSVAAQFAKAQKPNIDVYLKAWSGDPIIRDRKGGDGGPESMVVDDALLTVVLTIQPGVVEKYRETAPELRGRGFFARFMPSLPESLVGGRRFGGRPKIAESATEYATQLAALADRMAGIATAGRPMRLALDDDAAAMFYAWCDDMERKLAAGAELAALHDAASKIRSSCLRMAGLLKLAIGGDGNVVSADRMADAIVVARYWTDHAMLMEGAEDDDQFHATACAFDILEWCRKRRVLTVTPRDVYLAHRSTYRTVDQLAPGFELLWDKRWLTFEEGHVSKIGSQRTSVVARVSAEVLGDVHPRQWSSATRAARYARYNASGEDEAADRAITRVTRALPKSAISTTSSSSSSSAPPTPEPTRVTRVIADDPDEELF
jgi:hypothetical protein